MELRIQKCAFLNIIDGEKLIHMETIKKINNAINVNLNQSHHHNLSQQLKLIQFVYDIKNAIILVYEKIIIFNFT